MFQPLDRGKPSDKGLPSDRGLPPDRDMPCPYGYADDELLRYALEGESVSYLVEEHIIKCKSCRQHVESLMSINSFLVRKLYRNWCPDIDTLARYSADLTSLSEGLLVFYHLQSCPLCAQELQEMKSILEDDIF